MEKKEELEKLKEQQPNLISSHLCWRGTSRSQSGPREADKRDRCRRCRLSAERVNNSTSFVLAAGCCCCSSVRLVLLLRLGGRSNWLLLLLLVHCRAIVVIIWQ